ncbi:MAG: hypothetical protein ACI915_003451 [Gammaproteobacteria bacterium]|jgi:hypothetical protein
MPYWAIDFRTLGDSELTLPPSECRSRIIASGRYGPAGVRCFIPFEQRELAQPPAELFACATLKL